MAQKTCKICKKRKTLNHYVKNLNHQDGHGIICTDCRRKFGQKGFQGLQEYCTLDKRNFSQVLWNQVMQKSEERINKKNVKFKDDNDKYNQIEQTAIGLYFSKMNLGKTYGDKEIELEILREQQQEEIPHDLIKFWGRFNDYTLEDYEFLSENYDSWIMECKSDTLAEKKLYKQICLQELEIKKLREKGTSVIKEVDTLQKLMDSANVKPKDINSANDPSNASVLGMIIKDIEQYRPSEYFEDKKIYLDFDNIREYWTRFVTRPLKNLLTGSRDFDKEFNLETSDGDESDG